MPLKDNELAYRVRKMKHNFWKHFDEVHIFSWYASLNK